MMETTNWRCPTCETVNTGDFCTVCGCQKPDVNSPGNVQQPVNSGTNFVQPSFEQPSGGMSGGQNTGYAPNPEPTPNPGYVAPNPAGISSGKKAWKIISIILLYVISIVMILWVSITVGTILLAVSVGYNVRVVNWFKNEKAKLESERRKMNVMR